MEMNIKIDLYKRVMERFGYQHQMLKAVEECAELTDALIKHQDGRATEEQVLSELADVVICCEQLALHFGVVKAYTAKEAKLNRLAERMTEAQEGETEPKADEKK